MRTDARFRAPRALRLAGASTFVLASFMAAPFAVGASAAYAADPTAAAPAAAAPAPAASDQNQTQEVVVTAQFRAQNLQKTPLAITAVTAQSLEARGQTNIADVTNEAPNVTLKVGPAAFGPTLQATIRGVGQQDFSFAEEPGVGMYVDDVYYGTTAGTILDLIDVGRVEILRGPQGTLAGQNSIGGSIKLFSKTPNGDDGGSLQVGYGSYNKVDVRGTADFTVIPDQLFVRLAGVSTQQDGYVTRYDYGCSHPGSGVPSVVTGPSCVLGHEGGISHEGVRGSLRWVPTDRLEVNINGDYTQENDEASPSTLLFVGYVPGARGCPPPGGPGVCALNAKTSIGGVPLGYPIGTATSPVGSPFISYSIFPNQALDTVTHSAYANYSTYCDPSPIDGSSAYCNPAESHFRGGGISGVIDFKLTDHLAIKSISAYREYDADWSTDEDGSPVGDNMVHNIISHNQFSEELRLNGDLFDNAVKYTVGGFYFDENSYYSGRIDLSSLEFFEKDSIPANFKAVFGNVDWSVTDKLEISGGLRYTEQEKSFNYGRLGIPGNTYPDCTVKGVDYGRTSPLICGLNGSSGKFTGDHLDYRAAAQYQWTPDLMTYASVSTGFKGGGVNPRPFFTSQEQPFGPETLTAYELGFKSTWFDRRVRLDGAVFYNNYDAIQVTVNSCPQFNPPPTPTTVLGLPCAAPLNSGNARVEGAELEGEFHPIDGLTIDGTVSYLDFKFTSLSSAAKAAGITAAMTNSNTPKSKYSLGVQYAIQAGSLGSFTPRIDVSYQSSMYSAVPNSIYSLVPAYTLVNGGVTWRPMDNKWQVAVEVLNLTNQVYYNGLFDNRGSANAVMGAIAPPREWEVTVKRNF